MNIFLLNPIGCPYHNLFSKIVFLIVFFIIGSNKELLLCYAIITDSWYDVTTVCIYKKVEKPPSGADPEILERGGQKPNSRKGGGQNSTFQCGFQSFSYKSLTNIPAKGEGGCSPSGPSPKSAPAHVEQTKH